MTTEAEPTEIPIPTFLAMKRILAEKGHKGISSEDRDDLIVRAKRGEKRAVELLLLTHERFIQRQLKKSVYRKRSYRSFDMQEVMQEGRVALIRAIRTYDPARAKFTTYLDHWLNRSMLEHNSAGPLIRIHPNLFMKSSATKVDPEKAAIVRNVVSFDDPIPAEEEGITVEDSIRSDEPNPEETFSEMDERRHAVELLRSAIRGLSARDRKILELRWLSDGSPTLDDIAEMFDLSRERVRQIEANVFYKIRQRIEREASSEP